MLAQILIFIMVTIATFLFTIQSFLIQDIHLTYIYFNGGNV